MSKTQNLHHLLNELNRTLHLEPKILEQKVFALWREYLGAPLGTKTVPVSLSDGTLKIYTEYPPYRTELLFHKQKILDNLNAELGESVVTELRIELRQVRAAHEAKRAPSKEKKSKVNSRNSKTANRRVTPEKLERIEQSLASVTDTQIKKSLRRLFITQSEDKP
jgi:predicted nucleic acid-binding Zn ribbon protein